MSRFLKSALLSLVFSLSFVSITHAQGIPGVGTPVSLVMQPTSPRPGETVSFSLQSYNVDLDASTITWTLDGKRLISATGAVSASAVAGKLGSIQKLSVTAITVDGERFTQTATIRPAELSLLWQAGTYVPPFYQGKALHAFGGTYKVVAIPEMTDANGRRVDPKTLVYTWKKNDATEKDASGYGKSSFVSSQTGFVRGGDEIVVEVTNPADNFAVSRSITITPATPEILMYENNPLYGVLYEKELGSSEDLLNEEVTVEAEPYYFSSRGKGSAILNYSWTLNGSSVPAFQGKSAITLRKGAATSGISRIGLSVENTALLLQSANRELIMSYE